MQLISMDIHFSNFIRLVQTIIKYHRLYSGPYSGTPINTPNPLCMIEATVKYYSSICTILIIYIASIMDPMSADSPLHFIVHVFVTHMPIQNVFFLIFLSLLIFHTPMETRTRRVRVQKNFIH